MPPLCSAARRPWPAHRWRSLGADAVTLNPYLGDDALAPFVERCAQGRGVFVLARTSNPGAAVLQETDCQGRPLYLRVTDMIARLGEGHVGAHGYSDVGAVAGATAPTSLSAVRAVCRAPFCWFRASVRRAPAPKRSPAWRAARRWATWSTPRARSSTRGDSVAATT